MRERAIKFLAGKLKTLPEDVMTKEVEEFVFAETKKVVELDKCVFFIHVLLKRQSSNPEFGFE